MIRSVIMCAILYSLLSCCLSALLPTHQPSKRPEPTCPRAKTHGGTPPNHQSGADKNDPPRRTLDKNYEKRRAPYPPQEGGTRRTARTATPSHARAQTTPGGERARERARHAATRKNGTAGGARKPRRCTNPPPRKQREEGRAERHNDAHEPNRFFFVISQNARQRVQTDG